METLDWTKGWAVAAGLRTRQACAAIGPEAVVGLDAGLEPLIEAAPALALGGAHSRPPRRGLDARWPGLGDGEDAVLARRRWNGRDGLSIGSVGGGAARALVRILLVRCQA